MRISRLKKRRSGEVKAISICTGAMEHQRTTYGIAVTYELICRDMMVTLTKEEALTLAGFVLRQGDAPRVRLDGTKDGRQVAKLLATQG